MSKKLYLIEFDDSGLHSLSVADPTKKLKNGNLKIVKMLIGDYADEIYKHLIGGYELDQNTYTDSI